MAKPKPASLRSTLSSGQFVLAPGKNVEVYGVVTYRLASGVHVGFREAPLLPTIAAEGFCR